MYSYLAADFSSTEIETAIHQLKGTSAPGPDGISALFFHKYWEIVGKDIIDFTLSILNKGGSPEKINFTYISLIPKVSSPSTPSEFRPISLCNVVMKIITKTIASRIKVILPKIVNDAQSAFLAGRLITDNSLLAFEAFHYLKKPRHSGNCNNPFFTSYFIIYLCVLMYSYVINCLYVYFWSGIVEFSVRRVF
jgi:hypothetical protein